MRNPLSSLFLIRKKKRDSVLEQVRALPGIVKYRDSKTDASIRLEDILR